MVCQRQERGKNAEKANAEINIINIRYIFFDAKANIRSYIFWLPSLLYLEREGNFFALSRSANTAKDETATIAVESRNSGVVTIIPASKNS